MKTIQETVKDTIVETLDEIRNKSISQIKEKDITGGQVVEEKNIREKAITEAFDEFVRTGDIRSKAVEMSEVSAEAGAMTVPTQIYDRILAKLTQNSVMRQYARVLNMSVGNTMELILDDSDFTSAWVDETTGRVPTDAGKFTKVSCKVQELWAMPVISRWLLKDSMFDLNNFIVESVANKFRASEEEAFWYGTGDTQNQPKGLLDGLSTGDYTGITYKTLTEAIYDLPEQYASGATFFLNRKTMKIIKNLLDANNRPLFVETSDLSRKFEGYILGYPVKFVDAIKEGEIVFGNMYESYLIVDKPTDTGMQYDDITVKGKIQYPTWKRTGGTLIRRDGFKYIKNA